MTVELRSSANEAATVADALAGLAARSQEDAVLCGLIGGLTAYVLATSPGVEPSWMPVLIRHNVRIARALRRRPATRPLVRTLPAATRRTVGALTAHRSAGRTLTPRVVQRVAMSQTRAGLRRPRPVRGR